MLTAAGKRGSTTLPSRKVASTHAGQALVDRQETVDQRDQTIGAGGAHQRRANVRRPLGLIAAAAEIEVKPVAGLFDFDMDADRPGEIDAVVVDEAFALGFAVGP